MAGDMSGDTGINTDVNTANKMFLCPKCRFIMPLGSGDCPHCFDKTGELVKLELLPEKKIEPSAARIVSIVDYNFFGCSSDQEK